MLNVHFTWNVYEIVTSDRRNEIIRWVVDTWHGTLMKRENYRHQWFIHSLREYCFLTIVSIFFAVCQK